MPALWRVLILMALLVHAEEFICGGTNCAECSPPGLRTAPGVGIDLTMAYGTAAIQYKNGTTADLIRIGGTMEYRSAMRLLAEDALNVRSGGDSLMGTVHFEDPNWRNPYPLNVYWKYPWAWLYNLRTTLPRMVDNYRRGPPEFNPDDWTKTVASMLREIKIQALDTVQPPLKFNDMYISLPDFIDRTMGTYSTRFRLASHIAGLRLSSSPGLIASNAALLLEGLGGGDLINTTATTPSVVLAVSYNAASFGATLQVRDDDMFWPEVVVERPIHGADRVPSDSDGERKYWNGIKGIIERVIGNETVDHVLLLGSHARDDRLLNALKEVSEAQNNFARGLLNRYLRSGTEIGTGENNLTFTGARGAARIARVYMENDGTGFCWEPSWCIEEYDDTKIEHAEL
ncbi:hypothetical protein BJY04DRAFT_212652 [Aspergillus karnatakaensis]|uniref:uncharacterized protein n=1 Tax=Aspergillus karnatakaensis TaxID=1810916 RepID=UPI003CCDCAA9